MQSSLLLSDSKKFIDKYTRFLTKDMYISYEMNQKFLDEYEYLFSEFDRFKYLYQDQDIYKRVNRIRNDNEKLLRFHNQKYLKKAILDYRDFFDRVSNKDIIDSNMKMMILADEKYMVSIVRRNYISFLAIKIKYMIDCLKKNSNKINILVQDREDYLKLKKELEIYDLDNLSCKYIVDYEKEVMNSREKLVDRNVLYNELFQYIIKDLYLDKDKFNEFYSGFSSYIYLNRDYKDFDTFKDYHYYIIKRKYLDSKLSLKKYNEREIRKRRGQLRTINNSIVSCKEMVDVGNFLFLNSIECSYDVDRDCYKCFSKNKECVISFSKLDDKNCIVLNKEDRFLEKLVYELIKRQFGMEKCSDDVVFSMLRDTSMDSYFSEFIRDILIPSIFYYSENKSFDDTRYNDSEKGILINFYDKYLEIKKKYSFVSFVEIRDRVQKNIDKINDCFFVILGDLPYRFREYYIILKDYPNLGVSDNIRLFYEYRNYFNEHRKLASKHTYLGIQELQLLRIDFLKEYFYSFQKNINNIDKDIYICLYDDSSRIKSQVNLVRCVTYIIDNCYDRECSFMVGKREEIKNLLFNGYLYRNSAYQVKYKDKVISCCDNYKTKYKYSCVILPFLIQDRYHVNMLEKRDSYYIKMGFVTALDRVRDSMYLLCPLSKSKEIRSMFYEFNCVKYVDCLLTKKS